MKIKAVFFDLDGTLLYTIEDIAKSLNAVLRRHNFPTHTIEEYCAFIGDGMKMLVTRSLPVHIQKDVEQRNAIVAEFRKSYSVVADPTTRPYDGILELLQHLKEQGVVMAVVTNKPHEKALKVVEQFFPTMFEHIVGQREGIPVKPDPASAKEIQERLSLKDEEILYIGDSGVDMQLAVTAKYRSVGVSWGYRTVEELKERGAETIIYSPLELLALCC